jgi:simple sugar transport system ATP-binding protein
MGITKDFGALRAVSGVSASFEAGRIHAVVGENGAGKSTLLKIAAGIVTPTSGDVFIDEQKLAPHTAAEAILRGVAMVQQHFALIGVFTALENVVLGAEPTKSFGTIDFSKARAKVETIAEDLGVAIPFDAVTESLGVGDRQRLEIVRALYRDARVLILDEPTAVLTPAEAITLYTTLRRLADAGKAIVVVTHKLDEVRDHADDVTVLRRGAVVLSRALGDDRHLAPLAAAIMGGEAPEATERKATAKGDVVIRVAGVGMGRTLRGVDLTVRAGEIVGIAGVEGNGQTELVRVLARLDTPDAGTIETGTASVVHEDRLEDGLVLDASLRENLVLGELARFARFDVVDEAALDTEANARLVASRAVPTDLDALARALSGGNQQKIVMARAIARTALSAPALVLAHPTRGVDLGAARAIHERILDCAARGVAVLVVSADLHELRALSDRILVMARGAIVADLAPTSTDAEIGAAMLGGVRGKVA